jgi:hypothetical protein
LHKYITSLGLIIKEDTPEVISFMEFADPKKTGFLGIDDFLAFFKKYAKQNEYEYGWRILSSFNLDKKKDLNVNA